MLYLDPDTPAKIFIILLVLYGTSLHEMAHAYVATWLGDPTPGQHGRLTMNPIPHLQPFIAAVVVPVLMYLTNNTMLGFATTPINPSRFRNPLRDHALVAVVGPMMNFLLAAICMGLLWIPGVFSYDQSGETTYTTRILFNAGQLNFILGMFNLLPIPPLDGYWIARPMLPLRMRMQFDGLARSPMALMLPLIVGSIVFSRIYGPLNHFYTGLLPIYYGYGQN